MCHIQLQFIFCSELGPFNCVLLLILCNLHSCTPHNSLTVHNIFIEFYRNVYLILGNNDVLHIKMVVPLI